MNEYTSEHLKTGKAEIIYGDIIRLSRPVSRAKKPMPQSDRAAQFSSFAALTGYEDAVKETARLTAERREPDEERQEQLNHMLRLLAERADTLPLICVVYFERDKKKSGGEYVTVEGRFRRIDEVAGVLIFTNSNKIPVLDIWEIILK